MAHFYGTAQGSRGVTSRTGSKNSGMIAHAYGWDIGGTVSLSYNEKTKTDILRLEVNLGSNNPLKVTHAYEFAIDPETGKLEPQ